jgi:hypothetical protein
MSAHDVRDGLLEAYERRVRREATWMVIAIACVAIAFIVGSCIRTEKLEGEAAKLRAMCGVQVQP